MKLKRTIGYFINKKNWIYINHKTNILLPLWQKTLI